MANLITDAQAKAWLKINDTADDTVIGYITAAVSSYVRGWCGRSFNVDGAQADSDRYFTPTSAGLVQIDDCLSLTSLATDDTGLGAWGTAWTVTTDYILAPVGGIGADGLAGHPYTSIKAVGSKTFPDVVRPAVKATGKWGWTALPGDVFLACEMLVGEMFRAKSGGFDTFTTDGGFTQIRRNLLVRDLLQPYRRATANDARFVVA